ncbi:MAG: hypothetical protein QGH40_09960, partial [bacterium]|nr:hypothetical protein [bacterium]
FRREFINTKWNDLKIGKWWDIIIKYFFPVQLIALFGWYLYQTWSSPSKEWWHKGHWAVIVLLLEWAAVMVIAILLNRKLGNRLDEVEAEKRRADEEEAAQAGQIVEPLQTYEIIDFGEKG